MNLDFAAMQENIDACDAQIAASGAVLGMMDEAISLDLGDCDGWAECTITVMGKPTTFFIPNWSAVERGTTGALPTAEEMKPAIRSVVQSVAADLLKLPVREMSGEPAKFHEVQLSSKDAAFLESDEARRKFYQCAVAGSADRADTKPAPAGLTRLATDGERNGSMAWVPGAR
jgi:hypothetical protein